ncbi:uncharacterized protein LOC111597715 [Drosophila hydei]|uniref:Uncharacterized protein LOC111597715 n=1 Tax=Drosophila hydei TaxID=7224 RepID=A0A6J1LT51_DROHY|nr:uncharacterized protein LOC111597715 [Drosophila hydei]
MCVTTRLVAFLFLLECCLGARNWVYEPLSVEVKTSDPTKLNIEAKLDRIGRDFTISITLDWNYDVDETTMVEAYSYRSASGNENDYTPLPWTMPRQTYKKYTETYYQNIVYKNLANCSNLPKPDNVDPWPRGQYILDKCVANGDGLPEIAPEGYYKVIFQVFGEVDWEFLVISKLTNNKNILG